MYLSKLDILGFKSFAQKTTLQLNEGISCIIGPNGAGKSNIVDAIRWVLGEQKTNTLRTDRMENVIFNGTNTRKALGMAEVSLTIQNNKNILKSSFTDVVISRRLYRSGESHYLINKAPCRLKDITDLFMDTGMGSNSYSVIELGMVESIISENPADRRHLFEEAAGINKYKSHRKSAIRKLDSTIQDMERISDLISEIQRTVNSLSRQVGKARRYLNFKDELKIIEIDLARYRFTRLMDEIDPLHRQLKEIRVIKEDTSHQITLEEALLEEYKREIIQFENRLQEYVKQMNAQDDQIYNLKEEEAVAQARAQAWNETIRRNSSDVEEYRKKIADLIAKSTENKSSEEDLQKQVSILEQAYSEQEKEYTQASSLIETNKGTLQEINNRYKEASSALLAIRERIQEKTVRLTSTVDSIAQIEDGINNSELQQKEFEQELDEIRSERDKLHTEQNKITAKHDKASRDQEQLLTDIDESKGRLQKLLAQRDADQSRVHFFEQLISKYEGHSQGAQFLMKNQIEFPGLIGPIADLIRVEDRFKPAVETALGDTINYLVVESLELARNAIDRLQKEKSGRVTLLPLDLLQSITVQKNDKIWQDDRLLAAKIECEDQYRKIFEILLGDVLLVDSLDTAVKESRNMSQCRFVTQNGELIEHGHAISGGQRSEAETSVIGRKDRLDKLQKSIKKLIQQIADLEADILQKTEKKNKIIGELENIRHEKSSIDTRINEAERKLAQKEYESSSLLESIDQRTRQISGNRDLISELEQARKEIQQEADTKQKEIDQLDAEIQQISGNFEGENKKLQSLANKLHGQHVQLIEEQNKLQTLRSEISRMASEISDLETQITRRETETKSIKEQLAQYQVDKKDRADKQEIIWNERDRIESDKEKVQESYHEIKEKIINLENQIKKYRKQHDSSLERTRQLELQIQENEMKAEVIKDRIREEYNEDITVGIANENLNVQECEQRIDSLKFKINQLGQVNPLAVAEYDKENERLEFYTKQYNDLQEAEKSLRKTINKINITARNQFVETFDLIKANFERVFSSFFQNGDGTLKIEDNSDPLEANIEILVRTKGKRAQTIHLLSGGEKTLTAISLLFAIYLVKPSPFCILDEIDAPLDDVNISRFTTALKDFSKETQFLVVTHNKRTMEAAETMYGVTMEEEGMSKLVSVKFN